MQRNNVYHDQVWKASQGEQRRGVLAIRRPGAGERVESLREMEELLSADQLSVNLDQLLETLFQTGHHSNSHHKPDELKPNACFLLIIQSHDHIILAKPNGSFFSFPYPPLLQFSKHFQMGSTA